MRVRSQEAALTLNGGRGRGRMELLGQGHLESGRSPPLGCGCFSFKKPESSFHFWLVNPNNLVREDGSCLLGSSVSPKCRPENPSSVGTGVTWVLPQGRWHRGVLMAPPGFFQTLGLVKMPTSFLMEGPSPWQGEDEGLALGGLGGPWPSGLGDLSQGVAKRPHFSVCRHRP